MNSPIYITLATDDNYARHMGIVVLSLLANTAQPKRLYFFFLDAGISPENRERISAIVQQYGSGCEFIRPASDIYGDIPKKRYGVAALFRLSLGTLLPPEVGRVLYLDCDVLAFDDVEKMWQIDLGDNIVGAVTNLGHQPKQRLGIPDGDYFNSGVLLIDLNKWREHRVGEETLSYMTKNAEQLVFPDQDGLNCVLKDSWQPMPLRWNQQPASYSMYKKGKTERSLAPEAFREAVLTPGIVHYLGKNKPWNYMTFHPLKENYWAYLARSPWAEPNLRPDNYSYPNILKKALLIEKNLKHYLRRFATPAEVRRKGF